MRTILFCGLMFCTTLFAKETFTDFDGNVEVHIKHVVAGEELIQIIDHSRAVICYGKMNTGGASTISCQKFTEPSKRHP